MASFMPSTYTTGERRKKVTYGKLSRLPPPRPSFIETDAPSPERPHKHTSISDVPAAGSSEVAKSARAPEHAHAATTSPDVFDVPSEDEFGFESTTSVKRPVVQRSKTDEGPRLKNARIEASVPTRPVATVSRSLQKAAVAKPAETTTRTLQEQIRPKQPGRAQGAPSEVPPTSDMSQTKASQPTEGRKQTTTSGQRLQRSNTTSKNASRATTPGLSAQPASKSQPAKTASAIPLKKTAKPITKLPASLDVFDVPSDNEEASLPIPEAPRQTSRQVSKGSGRQLGASKIASTEVPQKVAAKHGELGSLQNRKRKGSLSSSTVPKVSLGRSQELSMAQRGRKVPRRDKGASPGHDSAKASMPRPASRAASVEAAVNKPRRTITRTVPVINQPAIPKGQSSPAVLHKMIPVEQASSMPHEESATEVPASDDTMYDIPDSMTTPVRPTPLRRTTTSTPGSVTPRQKDLFSTLLGGSTAPKTPASAFASLQLTDKKPRSLLGALARSKSDVAYSTQPRKTRLIAALKDEDTSSEEDSGSDEEADSTIVADLNMDNDKTPMQAKRTILEKNASDLNREETTATDSQTSQMTSGAVARPRLTYATQRSYLQDANPEEEFLMSMDIDDNWKMDSQTVSTDDEDGPTSQPRTHHELRKYGQNTMFSWDMEESIREISDESNKSGRRSAMIDLCTKMADAGFISQLLDSGFMHQLLDSITSGGDTVFDFIMAVSILFILQTRPAFAVVDQIYRSGVMTNLIKLVANDADISRIARDRKFKMSKIAQESLADFRTLVLAAKAWFPNAPEKASPQILALKTVDLLIRNLRESGSTEALLIPTDVSKLVTVCSLPSDRVKAGKSFTQDLLVLDLTVSILETVSIADQDYSTWPANVLQTLSEVVPLFFEDNDLTNTAEALKLCVILTNNKPKACQPFSTQPFVGSLIRFVVRRFDLLHTGNLDTEHRTQVLDALTLGLGTMINLAELSDQARLNAIGDSGSIEALVKTFVVGSERAAEADSLEESKLSVQIGFLTVLLGNLCLNTTVRSKVQAALPGQQFQQLLDMMKVFARIHEHADKKTASNFEGPEGQQALNNYYVRIMHVVKKLESMND